MKKAVLTLATLAAVAAVATTPVSAAEIEVTPAADGNNTVTLLGDGAVVDDFTAVEKVTFYVTYDQAELDNADTWIGGGIGTNSESTGWAMTEWGKASGEKAIAIEDTLDGNKGTITYDMAEFGGFADTDTYAQVWLQAWGGTVTVDKAVVTVADSAAPAEEEPAVEPTEEAPAEEEPAAEPELPKTGTAPVALYVGFGSLMLLGGVVIANKKRA
jgi:LPXTG-motif cell wall-anchored protein